jgi:hypothetical protein
VPRPAAQQLPGHVRCEHPGTCESPSRSRLGLRVCRFAAFRDSLANRPLRRARRWPAYETYYARQATRSPRLISQGLCLLARQLLRLGRGRGLDALALAVVAHRASALMSPL